MEFPAYKKVAVADLIPYARNSRTHSEEQVAQIAASIREFGFLNPVIIDGAAGLVAGHGRVLAARKLGLQVLPAIEAGHLTEAQRRAYVIADNKLAENAGWDLGLLKVELEDLQSGGFDLGLTGFSLDELQVLFAEKTAGLTDPDDAPALAGHAVSVLGDVWVLGQHRIICGSSTDAHTVERVLAGHRPHLMVTDPPYGVNYDPAWRKRAGVGGAGTATGVVLNDDRADWREAWDLFPGSVAYVWHGGLHSGTVAESLIGSKFGLRAQIIWAKTRFAMSRGHYHWQHEPAWYAVRRDEDLAPGHLEEDHWRFVPEHEVATYAVREGKVGAWEGGRKQSTLWFIEHIKCDTGHGTQKPVECMKRPMENNSRPGDRVYEPFSGSGSTIIAGEMAGRPVHAVELNPLYVDVAVKRWQEFTGKQALLEADSLDLAGLTFDQVAGRRA